MQRIFIVKAFTKDANSGNPTGVILNADKLSQDQMLSIAASLNFSESAFISKSKDADFHTRYFSPLKEVDLCGHATIASIHTLFENKYIEIKDQSEKIITIETKAGKIKIRLRKDVLIKLYPPKPKFLKIENDISFICSLLNLSEHSIDTKYPMQTIDISVPKLMIPIKSLELLYSIVPDLEKIKKYSLMNDSKGLYPFTFETLYRNSDFHARQFNPLAGIDEDPITGIAAGSLGIYSLEYDLLHGKKNIIIEQGWCMNKGGLLYVSLNNMQNISIGGYAFIQKSLLSTR